MPGKSGRSGRYAVQRHDDAYWARLRKEFENCEYENSGAYCTSALPERRRNFLVPNRLEAALRWKVEWVDD